MEEYKFSLVKSIAGHDKNSWYALVKQESSGFVYIADGRRRKLNQPKKKNIKHIEITSKFITLEYYTDKQLRKALWEYNFSGTALQGRCTEVEDEEGTACQEKM